MDAIVAIYVSLGSQNPLMHAPLSTPPVPISPAVNPDNAPHKRANKAFAGKRHDGRASE